MVKRTETVPARTVIKDVYETVYEQKKITIPGTPAKPEIWENGHQIQKAEEAVPDQVKTYNIARKVLVGQSEEIIPEHTVEHYEYIPGEIEHIPAKYGSLNKGILNVIDDLTEQVSSMRSELGAQENRLESAYRYNQNTRENLENAESRIRDTDMASEMVNYSTHNILEQVGQSMLSQANQNPQNLISLLQ